MADMTVTNGNLLLQTDPANPAASLCISRMDLGQTVPLAQIGMYGGGTGNLQGVLSFRTMNSGGTLEERLHIHTDGNVGIGTNAPAQKLEVSGTIKAAAFQGNGSGLTNVSGTDATKVSKSGDTMTGALNLPTNGLVVGTSQLVVSNGNVGIGTSSPSYPLEVNGDLRANRYRGLNSLSLNDYQTANPSSNVYLYSPANDRDSWLFLDSADTGSNWGIYHRQIDSPVKQLPANSIGFIGGGNSDLKAYICLGDGAAYFKGNVSASALNVTGAVKKNGDEMPSIVGVSQAYSNLPSTAAWQENILWGKKTSKNIILSCQAWNPFLNLWGNSAIYLWLG